MLAYYLEARDLVHSTPNSLICSYSNQAHKELQCITLALDTAWSQFTPLAKTILNHLFEENRTEEQTAQQLHLSRRQVRNQLQRVFRQVAHLTGLWTPPNRGKGTGEPIRPGP
jgi:DNA-binding CsgD family transcriptional regulator